LLYRVCAAAGWESRRSLFRPVTIDYSTFSGDNTIMKGIEQSGFIQAMYKLNDERIHNGRVAV
jgi:hypothetical protein